MKLYLLETGMYDTTWPHSIWSTRELAQAAALRYDPTGCGDWDDHTEIKEMELDKYE